MDHISYLSVPGSTLQMFFPEKIFLPALVIGLRPFDFFLLWHGCLVPYYIPLPTILLSLPSRTVHIVSNVYAIVRP